MFGQEELVKLHKRRAEIIINMIVVCFGIVLARLWYLQIYKGNVLYEYSLKNRLKRVIVQAPRGMIYSKNDDLIVDNIPRFDAVLTPQFLRDRENTIKRLSAILNLPVKVIRKRIRRKRGQAKFRPIIIKKNISRKEVAIIETENSSVPGVSVETFISREYKDKKIGAHLLGYLSQISEREIQKYIERDKYHYRLNDFIGQLGIEKRYDLKLRGTHGHEYIEVDALGRKKKHINTDNFFKGIQNKKSIPGNNLKLTIDRDMQKAAFDAIGDRSGAAVAVDVDSGEVLTMVSRPSFDPSTFSKELKKGFWAKIVNNPHRPLRDRTIQEHYAPGSTFKTLTAIAALEEGIIDENFEVNCRGSFRFGRRRYHCWRRSGHRKTRLFKALRESCDVYFYKIATQLDIDVLAKYSKMFGLGEVTGIELPREIPGHIPTKSWKKKSYGEPWQKGETLSCVIGQSYMLTTPIQLASLYATIANGGKLFRPFVVKEVFTNSGDVVSRGEIVLKRELNISEKTLKLVREGLYQVANHPKGTVWWRRGKGLQMSGKTGTSQVISMTQEKLFANCSEKPYKNRHHALFVGFAPSDNPRVAVSAVIEHGCSGSKAASPVVVAVLEEYMKKYHPELKRKNLKKETAQFRAFLKKWRAAKAKQKKKEEEEEEEEREGEEE